uniref:HDC02494 n=1 Tax=Drosophila melanogaster TaxID=7227 RepID=Q6IHJ2_DROME|nr:TPA_inf: HDC02494 [Drosophila melanogaster]
MAAVNARIKHNFNEKLKSSPCSRTDFLLPLESVENEFQIKEANYVTWTPCAPAPWRCENRCRLQSKKRQVKASGVTL